MNGSRLPQGLGGTMARPGPTVADAGAAADGEGQGSGAKLGTKGPFSRPAGGCLHRCGSGRAALPRAEGRGVVLLPAAPGAAGNAGGQRQGWALLIGWAAGFYPRASSPPGTLLAAPGSLSPACHQDLSLVPPQGGSLLGARPSLPNLLGPATRGPGGHRPAEGSKPGPFPTRELG